MALLHIAGPQPVIARQLDTEGGDTGSSMMAATWRCSGLKTEGDGAVLDDRNGARATILGGLLYIVGDADPAGAGVSVTPSGGLSATFVEESLRPDSHYTTICRVPVSPFSRLNFPRAATDGSCRG